MQDPEQFKRLLTAYTKGTLSPGEEAALMDAIAAGLHRDLLGSAILTQLQQEPEQRLRPDQKHEIIQYILGSAEQAPPVINMPSRKKWYWAAAAILSLSIGTAMFFHKDHPQQADKGAFAGIGDIRLQQNTGADTMSIRLDDGSFVELAPGARLEYPARFTGTRRTVRLEGNAFFRITPNAQQPFYAYSRDLVTHVLGTSFSIRWDAQRSATRIAVRTGKVEVSHLEEDQEATLLTPNQQVIGTKEDKMLTASLVDTPEILHDGQPLVIKARPVSEICAILQDRYGIPILLENEKTGQDLFTGDLSHQSFYTALKIICLSLNKQYTIKGTNVIISQ